MAIYLIRHGETAWTVARRHTGSSDIPLTAVGEEEARRLGTALEGIRFARVLCSPLLRARRTAELAGVQPSPEIDPDLAEFDYGDYEGLTSEQILQRRPGWELWRDGCPGGETPDQVLARAKRVLRALEAAPELDYALFAHGHMLRAVAVAYLGVGIGLSRHLMLKVASISVLGQEHGIPAIEAWDQT